MADAGAGGYVADLPYTHGYYHELAPAFIRFGLLLQGLDPWADEAGHAREAGQFHYCELGYGQGVSANLHAAANPQVSFWGTDFLPEHAAFAQDLARRSGISAHWMACGFEALMAQNLPAFDCVALHGVWSWIDAPARQAVVDFLQQRLKPGGVVYLSYNVMPGWSAEKPLRDLLRLHTEHANPAEATADRVGAAYAFAQGLRQGRAAYFDENPRALQMLDQIGRDNIQVVAHEYFNRAWHIPYFADLARDLAPAGLEFAASLHVSDLAGEVAQRAQASGLQAGGLGPALRETAHDFLLNRRFRRDLFVRDAQRLPPAVWEARLLDLAFVLVQSAEGAVPSAQTPYGAVPLPPRLHSQLLRVLQHADTPLTLRALRAATGMEARPLDALLQVLAGMVAQGLVFPVFGQGPGAAGAADVVCDAGEPGPSRAGAINQVIAERAIEDDLLAYLASPVTGHAIHAARHDRLFLLAWQRGAREASDLARVVGRWAAGPEATEGGPDAGADLPALAERFIQQVVPLWRRLGILT